MHTTKGRCWFSLATVFGFAASTAQAEWITPNSIPNPPAAVASANGTAVYPDNLVTTQYKALGLNFSGGAAITTLNGVSVWAPTEMLAQPLSRLMGGPPVNYPAAQLSYYGRWSGASFVLPGTLKPTTATSVSIEIIGWPVSMWVKYANGSVVMPAYTVIASGPDRSQLTETTFPIGPGIASFFVFAPVIDPPPRAGTANMEINPAWGVAGVSFSTASEPSSLVLAGLGALGLTARFGWRRTRGAIA
jgi:hypothetical protein